MVWTKFATLGKVVLLYTTGRCFFNKWSMLEFIFQRDEQLHEEDCRDQPELDHDDRLGPVHVRHRIGESP
jgi:hypothetical protein